MSQEWYYSVDGDRQGPIGGAELKKLAEAGTLKPTDLVWKDGMADWVQAKSIKGLFGAGAPSGSKSAEQPAAKPRPAAAEEEVRPARSRRRDEDEEEERPRRRRDEDDEDEEDRPARSRRRDEDEDEDEDRAVRRRDDDEDEEDDDRPLRKRGRVPEDTANKKLVAGLLGILIGGLGIHKFYLGMNTAGLIMLLVTVLTCGFGGMIMGVIGLVEGIMYLVKSDEDFYETYIVEQKQWF